MIFQRISKFIGQGLSRIILFLLERELALGIFVWMHVGHMRHWLLSWNKDHFYIARALEISLIGLSLYGFGYGYGIGAYSLLSCVTGIGIANSLLQGGVHTMKEMYQRMVAMFKGQSPILEQIPEMVELEDLDNDLGDEERISEKDAARYKKWREMTQARRQSREKLSHGARRGTPPLNPQQTNPVAGQGKSASFIDQFINYCAQKYALAYVENPSEFNRRMLWLMFASDAKYPTVYKNKAGETLLIKAIQANDLELIEKLIALGANIEERDDKGWGTPLLHAAKYRADDAVECLLDHGADIDVSTKEGHPLIRVATKKSSVSLSVLIPLIKAGLDLSYKDDKQRTILHRVRDMFYILRTEDAKGLDVNAIDSEGNTPLHVAVTEESNENAISLLLKRGADPNISNNNIQTALDVFFSVYKTVTMKPSCLEGMVSKTRNPYSYEREVYFYKRWYNWRWSIKRSIGFPEPQFEWYSNGSSNNLHHSDLPVYTVTTALNILRIMDEHPTPAAISSAFRRMARKCHPDKGGSAEEFERINKAKQFLLEEANRPRLSM
ncbi:MAG TPA: ankyrin repeat domain-containing protein [Gammaproteobacteria bacterium]|nr:ankyrin repeat domain-containing protein [Gammaproteobacteria bacterium]